MGGRGAGVVGVGGRGAGVVGVGGQAEGGSSLPLSHSSSAVFIADDRNVHKPQDRPRRPLAAV